MEVGTTVSGRYQILALAGVGGMGKVYRSLDTKTNTEVAIKVLTLDPSKYSRRFMREAKVMSRLKHKNIIEYLGYGQTEEGAPYIVMEWVQGEDLRQRMNRQAVSLDEALRIISGLGDALALADKQGIIHRDLKPSNLMLVDSKMDTIKLLDFGIARGSDPDLERMTKTGVSIGTPGYMAPEQSRGESKIDGRADIYALGCVVYETLVGQRPFRGEDIVAVLARGAIEEPPRVSAHRTDISQAFDDLLADMMAFRPDQRPIDGSRAALRAASIPSTRKATESRSTTIGFGHEEKQATGILLSNTNLSEHANLLAEVMGDSMHTIEHLDNDTSVIAVRLPDSSTQELSYLCARYAVALRDKLPNSHFILHVELADWQNSRMARNAMKRLLPLWIATDTAQQSSVALSHLSARLLSERYSIATTVQDNTRAYLLGSEHSSQALSFQRQEEIDGPSINLIGRAQERELLRNAFDDCTRDSQLSITLLSGSAGIGKSRIREWFTAEIATTHPGTRFWYARCSSPSASYNLVGNLISQAAGQQLTDSLPGRRQKLRSLIMGILPADRVDHICEFIGELCNTSYVANSSRSILMAARGNPAMMRNQVLGAWREFFAALTRDSPLLLILEDLHLCDIESLQAIGSTLLSAAQKPIMVLALSRFQHDALWSELPFVRHTVQALSDAESANYLQALSSELHHKAYCAQGNPRFIQEFALVGDGDEIPASIILTHQETFSRLPSRQKRFLRAASVLGSETPLSCVSYLLGETTVASHESAVSKLCQHELLRQFCDDSGAKHIAFCDELTRLAVYATLGDQDRVYGHLRTADWICESWINRELLPLDILLPLAYHYHESQQDSLAVDHYYQAARIEMDHTNLHSAITLVTKAMSLECTSSQTALLESVLTTAQLWLGRNDIASEFGTNALEHLPMPSRQRSLTTADVIVSLSRCGATMDMQAGLDEILAQSPDNQEDEALTAIARAATSLCLMGKFPESAEFYQRLPKSLSDDSVATMSASTKAHLAVALAYFALCTGKPEAHHSCLEQAIESFSDSSQLHYQLIASIAQGNSFALLGEWQQAESTLRNSLEASLHHQLPLAIAKSRAHLGQVLTASGQYDEARDMLLLAMESFALQKNDGQANITRVLLSQTYEGAGVLSTAEDVVREALRGTNTIAQVRMLANAQLASVLLKQNRADEALESARESYELLSLLQPVCEGRTIVCLRFVESLLECQHNDRAKLVLKIAHTDLLAAANHISSKGRRLSYIEQVEENSALVRLAVHWNIDREKVSHS